MTKAQRKIIESNFYSYNDNRITAAGYISDCAYNGLTTDYSKPTVSGGGSNGIEANIINSLSASGKAYGWCVVFQKTMDKYRWELKDELMRKKYIEHKPRWRICREIGIQESTYYYWLQDILQTAYQWALELKLF